MSRITIIPSDTFCSIDGVGYDGVDMASVASNVHAVQWYDTTGWIEFSLSPDGSKPANETITSLTQFQPVLSSWEEVDYEHKNPPPPPPPTPEQNKASAIAMLTASDWTQIPSVSNPAESNPYLTNADAFVPYRNQLRDFVFNPVGGEGVLPVPPKEVWASA